MIPTSLLIDAHLAVGEGPHITPLDIDDILHLMDEAGVDRAVLGPVGRWAAVDNTEGNQVLSAWSRRHPGRLSAYAIANPWCGGRATSELRRALDDGAVGWKLDPQLQGVGLLSPLLEPLLDVVEAFQRPVYVVTGVPVASEPLQLAELARRRPEVTFIMGRSGRTDFSMDLLPALTSVSNIVAETAYNGAGLVRDLVRTLGPGRVVFASDAPRNDLPLEIERVRRSALDATELSAVLGETAHVLFGPTATTSNPGRR